MDYYDSDDDNFELIQDSPPPNGGEHEEEIVDLDGEAEVLNVVGTSDVNDNRHLLGPGGSAHDDLSSDDNGNPLQEADALYEEVSDAEDSDDEQTLIMPKRKRKEPAPVWKCATKIKEGARCNFCRKTFKSKEGNTTAITRHIINAHANKPEVAEMKSEALLKKKKAASKKEAKTRNDSHQSKITVFSVKRGRLDPIKEKRLEEQLIKLTILMNRPFSDVENPHFRKLLHIAEPNFICPGAKKLTKGFDKIAISVKESLKKDIVKDVSEAGHKTISVVSDHGTSGDRFRTKKNAVVVLRTTKDFVIKKDVVKMLTCDVSQTGHRIKEEVKEALVATAGYEEDWIINWKTDGEAKQLNATDPTKNTDIYMKINHRGKCVDHTLELASEDSIKQVPLMKSAVAKSHALVNYLKDSCLAKTEFNNIMTRLGIAPLSVFKGTDNRWFFKASETHRVLELKEPIEVFFDEYDVPLHLRRLQDDDWHMLLVYDNAMQAIVDSSKVLEGEMYPTASSVIPFLDNILEQLKSLLRKEKTDVGRQYINTLMRNLLSEKRFPEGYKLQSPYNVLSLLDPRYSDLYFDDDQVTKAIQDLINDPIFDGKDAPDEVNQSQPEVSLDENPEDLLSQRRAQLLARKATNTRNQTENSPSSFSGKMREEVAKLLGMRGCLKMWENPMAWWRINHESFPLAALYWRAHSSYPATSTPAERSFNMDGLILTSNRYNIYIKVHGGKMCFQAESSS